MSTEYEQAALSKIRESYVSSKHVVEQITANHTRVFAMLTMMRSAMVLGPGANESAMLIEYLDAALQHMDNMIGVIGAMHGVMSLVNAIMSEHEELPEKWEGVDG